MIQVFDYRDKKGLLFSCAGAKNIDNSQLRIAKAIL